MLEIKSFEVDLANPEDVQSKLHKAEDIAAIARKEAEAAAQVAERWDRVLKVLRGAAAADAQADFVVTGNNGATTVVDVKASSGGEGTSRELALAVIEEAGGPISAADVRAALPQFKKDTMAWTLSNLAKEHAVQRLRMGVYAPLSYRPQEIFVSSIGEETDT